MTEQTALGQAIEKHWREHRPQMVKDLQKQKQLKQALLEAQELTGDLLYELVSVKKMDYQAALEVAMREWALLPEEDRTEKPKARSGKPSRNSGKKSSRSRKRRYRKTSE